MHKAHAHGDWFEAMYAYVRVCVWVYAHCHCCKVVHACAHVSMCMNQASPTVICTRRCFHVSMSEHELAYCDGHLREAML
jgi:hypothetical protein